MCLLSPENDTEQKAGADMDEQNFYLDTIGQIVPAQREQIINAFYEFLELEHYMNPLPRSSRHSSAFMTMNSA